MRIKEQKRPRMEAFAQTRSDNSHSIHSSN